MPGGTRGAAHLTIIKTEGQKEQGDIMRRIRREPREGDITKRRVDISSQLHKIFRQSGMVSDMKVEDFFLRKLRETAINPTLSVPLLSRNLKGYVPNGYQTGIACGKYPAGVNQFTEVKVIHSGIVQYRRPDVRDDH